MAGVGIQAAAWALRKCANTSPPPYDSLGEAQGNAPGATHCPQEDAMHQPFRTLAVAAMLAAALAPTAFAGGMSASLQGPAKDGVTYTVLTYSCNSSESMRPSGWAEGVVKGERQTLPLTILPDKTPGSYSFQRTWPADGRWV